MSEPRRCFVAAMPPAPGARFELAAAESHHLSVLRLSVGDPLVLFDGRGLEAGARIVAMAPRVLCELSEAPRASVAKATVTLVQALPKGTKLDDIVRACTEAGVHAIHLAVAERSVSRPDGDRAKSKLDRHERIAREAARQSERAEVPELHAPASLSEVAARAPREATRLVLSPREGAPWSGAIAESTGDVWIIIGPEGGLSEAEEAELVRAGWALARLALPVLRVETAAVVAVAMIVDRLAER